MIIDCHVHVWPDEIAAAVVAGRPADMAPVGDGTVSGALRAMDAAGVDVGVALGVATKASTVSKTNAFIGSVPRDRFVPFGTVHPDLSVADNLAVLREHGIVGVKLHPLFQDVSFADSKVVDLLAALADEDFLVMVHVGGGGSDEANQRGRPHDLLALVRHVPHVRLIACHFGGFKALDVAEGLFQGTNALLETSWPPSVGSLDPDRIRRLIREHGSDKVVFGTDWPMTDMAGEVEAVRRIGLDPNEELAVLGGNLARELEGAWRE